MNRTASIRIKGIDLKSLKNNLPIIVLMILSVSALLIGVISVKNPTFGAVAEESFNKYIAARESESYFDAILKIAFAMLKLPVISFLSGTSVLGMVIAPMTLCYSFFNYGLLSGYIYSNFGLSGIVFNIFVLILPTLIVSFCLLLSALECILFSRSIALICIKGARPINLFESFKIFCLKHLFLALPIIASAIIDLALFNMFENYINF